MRECSMPSLSWASKQKPFSGFFFMRAARQLLLIAIMFFSTKTLVGEELDLKALATRPATRAFDLLDNNGRQLTLSRWDIDKRYYFVLEDSTTKALIDTAIADNLESRPTVYREDDVPWRVGTGAPVFE